MRTVGSARGSATASLPDPRSDLLVLAVGETESPLRSFLPVFGQQGPTHNSDDGVGVRAQQHVSQFMGHDIAEACCLGCRASLVETAHENDGATRSRFLRTPTLRHSGLPPIRAEA